MWTMICATANRITATAVTPGLSGPLITSQNGIAVSTADSAKPIR